MSTKVSEDTVNHPSHYNHSDKFEVIDVIEAFTQGYENSFVGYSVGNVVKYLGRAPYKHSSPLEDLKKARWYLDHAIKVVEQDESDN